MDKKIKKTKQELKFIYDNTSPFEFKDTLRELVENNDMKLLDVGRGNPNWVSLIPRKAFLKISEFAIMESEKTFTQKIIGSHLVEDGIAKRFLDFLKHQDSTDETIRFLYGVYNYGIDSLNISADEWILELSSGVLGANYPYPDRMLKYSEQVVSDFLKKILFKENGFDGNYDVFATEGGAAAMCYVFDSLVKNNLLKEGDTIALMTPIFTPYLEIPKLNEYKFKIEYINADTKDKSGKSTYKFSKKELMKLKNKDIKALFLVNPGNPTSVALNRYEKSILKEIVDNHNKELMIVTDDVYSTFAKGFTSLIKDLPYNTMAIYSYSKYYGSTGWRLGSIMLNRINIFDDKIKYIEINSDEVKHRYKELEKDNNPIKFIDRLVADSRKIALNHTAGLSTPQQIQMVLFSLYSILDEEEIYNEETISICKERQDIFFEGLNYHSNLEEDASYYIGVNMLEIATIKYGEEFASYIEEKYTPFDMLYGLANNHGVVLLDGEAFGSPKWSFRISLANLHNEEYFIVGQAMNIEFKKMLKDWKKSNGLISRVDIL